MFGGIFFVPIADLKVPRATLDAEKPKKKFSI